MLGHNARRVLHAQVQQAWAPIVEVEGPARVTSRGLGLLLGEERAGWGAIQDRATLILVMEAAAARRERGQLPGPAWWWGGRIPQARMGGGARTHREMQCCSPRYRWDHKRRRPEVRSRQRKTPHSKTRLGRRYFWTAAQTVRAQTTQATTKRRTEGARPQVGVVWDW